LDLATGQRWRAESIGAEVARGFWARHDDARESSAGFRAKLAAQPMDLERVANGAIGSLFTALEVPRCVCYPTLGLTFVAGEVLVPGQVAAAVNAAREAVPDGSVVLHAAPPE